MRKGIRKNFKHYLMLLPFFFFYAVFFLYPIFMGFNTSLYKWDSVNPGAICWVDELHQFAQIERFYPLIHQFIEICLHHRADRHHGGVLISFIRQQLERLLVGDIP